jgi:hypothetical protein
MKYNLKNPNPTVPLPLEKLTSTIQMMVPKSIDPASQIITMKIMEKYKIKFLNTAQEIAAKEKIWVGSDIS